MTHDLTWFDRARAVRGMGWTAVTGLLLVCVLLAGLPATASATTPEMRGEWEIVFNAGGQTLKGKTFITQEANAKGEFASQTVQFEDGAPGAFSGTLEGGTATVLITTMAAGPFPAGEFASSTMVVESGVNTLALSGTGTITVGNQKAPGTAKATRLRTYKQIEEQEAQEKREQEEREARGNVRGEWALTLESGPQVVKGVALIREEANVKNEFASSDALFESIVPGSFSGTLKGGEASVTIVTQATGPFPESKFTSATIAVGSHDSSMSGAGMLTVGAAEVPGTLTATRLRTYQEVTEQETREREAVEKQEQEAREAKEKQAREAAEKQAREAKEKQAREAAEKQAREAKEKQEREAAAKLAAGKAPAPGGGTPALVSVTLAGKSFTVSASGLLSLSIANPNPYAIAGRVTLAFQPSQAKKSSAGKGSAKSVSLGTISFGISPSGKQLVKLKLSQRGRLELTRQRTLHAIGTITTQASGQTATTKTLGLTLRASKSARSTH